MTEPSDRHRDAARDWWFEQARKHICFNCSYGVTKEAGRYVHKLCSACGKKMDALAILLADAERIGRREAALECAEMCAEEVEHVHERERNPDNKGSVSRNYLAGELRGVEGCRIACLAVAARYEPEGSVGKMLTEVKKAYD